MQPPAFSGFGGGVSWDHGMGEELRRLRRTVTNSISQCKVKGISGIPLAFVNIIPSYPSLSIFNHLLDFHELNEASNGSAEGQRLKELSPVVPLEFEICAVTKCLPCRTCLLVSIQEPTIGASSFCMFLHSFFALFSFLLWRSAGWCCDLLFIFSR